MMDDMEPVVVAVHRDERHRFTKPTVDEIVLIEGFGVEGDAHSGQRVQHLSRVRRDPAQPNLRQVHLIHAELFDQVAADGFTMSPGLIGENVTTRGVDLLSLPTGALLRLGPDAVVEITGLRNPCVQINGVEDGLMKRLVSVDASGETVRLAGVMSVVVAGGTVRAGDVIAVELPAGEPRALQPV
jgi:MOSC domain-containing protein YiiM